MVVTASTVIALICDLHKPINRGHRVMPCCAGCEDDDDEQYFHSECCHEYPCPTVELLESMVRTFEADVLEAGMESLRRYHPTLYAQLQMEGM